MAPGEEDSRIVKREGQGPDENPIASGDLKRKVSIDDRHDDDTASTKRLKHEDHDGPSARPAAVKDARSDSLNGQRRGDVRTSMTTMEEEKKRGRRLFGGLVNTLSQRPSSSTQQKRQREIERRREERRHKEEAEDEEKRESRSRELREVRMREQIYFDERVMRNKHSKMMRVAQYLKTRAQPPVYYLPYELSAAQKETIEQQIKDSKEIIEREREAFETRRRQHHGDENNGQPSTSAPQPSSGMEHGNDGSRAQQQQQHGAGDNNETGARPQSRGSATEGVRAAVHDDRNHDDAGDIVVEGDEDTVIY